MYNGITIFAGRHDHVSRVSRLLNDNIVQDENVWIMLPDHALDFSVLRIHELGSDDDIEIILREGHTIKISGGKLNLEPGLHQYRIELSHHITHDTMHLYFQYIMQSDNPDKPYLYMNRKEKE